jgi:hypothetical protein
MAKTIVYITALNHKLCKPLAMFNGEIVIHFPNYTEVSREPVPAKAGEFTFALGVDEEKLHVENGRLLLWEGTHMARKDPKEHVRCTIYSMKHFGEAPPPAEQAPTIPEEIDTNLLREIMRRATDQALIDIPYIGEGNLDHVKKWINGEEAQSDEEAPSDGDE